MSVLVAFVVELVGLLLAEQVVQVEKIEQIE